MGKPRKRITILGSTGSIGSSSVAVIKALGDEYQLVSASAHQQWQMLAEQARNYQLQKVVLTDISSEQGHGPDRLLELQKALEDTPTQVLGGPDHLVDLASDAACDTVIVAVVGAVGLPAVLAAAQAGKTVAIANKESLVMAGCLVMPLAKECGATILPIDSEHSAIMQAMHAGRRREVRRVIITCSGGPFRDLTAAEMAQVRPADALQHPTWAMGPKITIDSATRMNKALEIIEACWLFDLEPDQIEVLVHPESIVHSLVEFCDGSVIAQLSHPDMRLPIQYALTYPERLSGQTQRLNLQELRQLTFRQPDLELFPALKLGFEAARSGGTAGAVLNEANEAAVEAFRAERIGFTQITELADHCLRTHKWIEKPNLKQLLAAQRWARDQVAQRVNEINADNRQAKLKTRTSTKQTIKG